MDRVRVITKDQKAEELRRKVDTVGRHSPAGGARRRQGAVLEVEGFGGGIVGFRLQEEGAEAAEAPAKVKGGGRRKAAAG